MRFGLKSKDLSLTYLKATQPPSILRPPLSHLRELVVVQDCKVSLYANLWIPVLTRVGMKCPLLKDYA